MTNLSNQYPIIDRGIAYEAAETEAPFRELSLQAKSLGNMALAGKLADTANKISDTYLNGYYEVNSTISPATVLDTVSTQELAEKNIYDAESIDEILMSTFFANKYYIDNSGEDTTVVANGEKAVSMNRQRGRGHTLNHGDELLGRMIQGQKPYEIVENTSFSQAGISEIVTLIDPAAEVNALTENYDDRYRTTLSALKRMSGATLHDETLKVLHYKIVYGTERFKYTDPHGRNGAQSEFIIVLPSSQADSLYSAMQSDPNLVRTMNDAMMLKVLDATLYRGALSPVSNSEVNPNDPQALWNNRRPPYSEWKKHNDGVARMAFRDNIKKGPVGSTVVEF